MQMLFQENFIFIAIVWYYTYFLLAHIYNIFIIFCFIE